MKRRSWRLYFKMKGRMKEWIERGTQGRIKEQNRKENKRNEKTE